MAISTIEEVESDNLKKISDSLNKIAESMENQQKDYDKTILKLKERIENLEEAIRVVPEFYEYWKGLNACGYND